MRLFLPKFMYAFNWRVSRVSPIKNGKVPAHFEFFDLWSMVSNGSTWGPVHRCQICQKGILNESWRRWHLRRIWRVIQAGLDLKRLPCHRCYDRHPKNVFNPILLPNSFQFFSFSLCENPSTVHQMCWLMSFFT